jgi:hypothetical protein
MSEPNPFQTVIQIAGGACVPRCLHVVADLGVADALDDAPRTAAELAASVDADPDALGRVLRLLASYGVFEVQGNMVQHSPASRLMRTDHPQSMRALARMFGLSPWWASYGEMEYAVRTGRPAAERIFPEGAFAHLAQHPEQSAIFNAAMTAKAQAHVAGILACYDWSSFRSVGDIGGGRGHLLKAILDAAPDARGVLFDLPHVVEEASEIASDRLALHAGDFFSDPLPACDAYVVMEVIHDWADDAAIAILQAIRQAAPPHARVLVIEQLVPEDPAPHWSKMLDIHMLALLGGRQRTLQEYNVLFDYAGLSFQREIDTGMDISILEAAPV